MTRRTPIPPALREQIVAALGKALAARWQREQDERAEPRQVEKRETVKATR